MRQAMREDGVVQLSWSQAEEFLAEVEKRRGHRETVGVYRRNLRHFFQFIEPDGLIDRGTVASWRDALLQEGYKPSTVNLRLSAVNGLLGHLQLRDFQSPKHFKPDPDEVQPSISREEYLHLLDTARSLDNESTYLAIKLFALTGLNVSYLANVTVQAVEDGVITHGNERMALPPMLQDELRHFIAEQGIEEGPIFLTVEGVPLNRSSMTNHIQVLGRRAGIAKEKCTPRCLRKLYHSTQAQILEKLAPLAQAEYDQLVAAEQARTGWNID